MVPYVDAVVAVTVMRVLLFVLHVCKLTSIWSPLASSTNINKPQIPKKCCIKNRNRMNT